MMKKSFLTAFAAVVILIACKNGEKEAIIVKESINPNFNVEVDAYVAKKDGFGLYFSEDNTVNFTPENVVWCDIEPQTQAAKLILKFQRSVCLHIFVLILVLIKNKIQL